MQRRGFLSLMAATPLLHVLSSIPRGIPGFGHHVVVNGLVRLPVGMFDMYDTLHVYPGKGECYLEGSGCTLKFHGCENKYMIHCHRRYGGTFTVANIHFIGPAYGGFTVEP